MKNILWLHTGGTIACTEKEGQGFSPTEDFSAFFGKMLSLLPENINATPRALFNLDSTNIKPCHWRETARAVFGSYNDYDGFVITHGTDTMQYTAAALSLMLKNLDKPVILTGSQKPFHIADSESDNAYVSDAPFNFTSAFMCAAEIPRGVYICFHGRIISGESGIKLHSLKPDGFSDACGDFGKIEKADGGFSIKLLKEPACCQGSFALADKLCEDVFYLKLTPNTKADIADYIRQSCYRGVVCEAFGLGGVPEKILSGLAGLCRDGIRVVLVSQCVYGGVDLNIYSVGKKALGCGIEDGGSMTGSYAMVKLMWELGNL